MHKIKIFVPGNHCEPFYWNLTTAMAGLSLTIDGYIEVFGAPWLEGMLPLNPNQSQAFFMSEAPLKRNWEKRPAVLEILVSHQSHMAAVMTEGDSFIDLYIFRSCPRLVVCDHRHWASVRYEMENQFGEASIIVKAACSDRNHQALTKIVVDF